MNVTPRPRVKICCIANLEEAQLAIRYGASALGLVSEMPSGPGVLSEAEIAVLAARVPPPIASFLLTCRQEPEAIIEQQRRARATAIQICDSLPFEAYPRLRAAMPGIGLVQVIHVVGPASVDEAESVAPYVDAVLLDSGNPSLPIKELGGTGRTHDWRLSRTIRERLTVPVFLAGGLNPGNVADALALVGPFGIDICSGVRVDGRLDEERLAGFFGAIDTWYCSEIGASDAVSSRGASSRGA